MVKVKINNEDYSIPTKIEELTVGQFFGLRTSNTVVDEICALAGIDRETILNLKSYKDVSAAQILVSQFGAVLAKGFNANKRPKQITFGGKTISIPKDLKLEPVGAFIAVHDILATQTNKFIKAGGEVDYTDQIPLTLAHYLYVPYTGELYSDEKAEGAEFMEKINQIRFVDAVPIANFFFRKYPNLN